MGRERVDQIKIKRSYVTAFIKLRKHIFATTRFCSVSALDCTATVK